MVSIILQCGLLTGGATAPLAPPPPPPPASYGHDNRVTRGANRFVPRSVQASGWWMTSGGHTNTPSVREWSGLDGSRSSTTSHRGRWRKQHRVSQARTDSGKCDKNTPYNTRLPSSVSRNENRQSHRICPVSYRTFMLVLKLWIVISNVNSFEVCIVCSWWPPICVWLCQRGVVSYNLWGLQNTHCTGPAIDSPWNANPRDGCGENHVLFFQTEEGVSLRFVYKKLRWLQWLHFGGDSQQIMELGTW